MATHPVVLPGEYQGQRSLAGYGPWGHREADTTERITHTYIHMYPFSPKLPSHPGCHITLASASFFSNRVHHISLLSQILSNHHGRSIGMRVEREVLSFLEGDFLTVVNAVGDDAPGANGECESWQDPCPALPCPAPREAWVTLVLMLSVVECAYSLENKVFVTC